MTGAAEGWTLALPGGARFAVPPSLDQISTYVLLEQDDWFEDEIRFVRRVLRPGMRAVDIGANLGVYAVAMALGVAPGGRVWAYEPAPGTAAWLEHNLALNGCAHAKAVRAAVSERPGTVGFAIGPHPELNAVAAEGGTPVEATTIDAEAAGWGPIDFLKLDVEGHEAEAVRGGAAFFRAADPLVMVEVRQEGRTDTAALDLLAAAGYGRFRLLPGLMMLEPMDTAAAPDKFQLNLFACKPARARALCERGLLVEASAPAGGRAPARAWRDYAARAPYARGFAGRWRRSAGWLAAADADRYFEGLAAWACAQDAARPAQERAAWLRHSLDCVARALKARDSLARRLSHARIAADAGWRAAAVDSLVAIADRVDDPAEASRDEPFLAPSARHEALDAAGGPHAWLRCAVLESLERLHFFSSCFSGEGASAIFEALAAMPERAIGTDRRLQLRRLRRGLPLEPHAAARLSTPAPDHLNADFWKQHA